MQAAFGRGALYTADGNHLLADIYYFIQPKTCLSRFEEQLQGFIDPILEYTALSQVLPQSPHLVIQLDDGMPIDITLDKGHETSSQIPLFFTVRSTEANALAFPDEFEPIGGKPGTEMHHHSQAAPGTP